MNAGSAAPVPDPAVEKVSPPDESRSPAAVEWDDAFDHMLDQLEGAITKGELNKARKIAEFLKLGSGDLDSADDQGLRSYGIYENA